MLRERVRAKLGFLVSHTSSIDLMRMKSMIETGVPPHDAARKDQNACFVNSEPRTSMINVEVNSFRNNT